MNLLYHLHRDKLDSLGYDTVYLEKPVPDIWKNLDWKNILQPPPSNLSKITTKEIQLLSRLTSNRNSQEEKLVLDIDKDMDTPFKLLCKNYQVEYPIKDIREFHDLIKPILLNIKGYYNRPRPNQLAPYFDYKINVIVTDTHHTASYPSGHTVYSKLVSLFLKNKYDQIDKFKLDTIVNQTTQARILQGVHYPSDCEASLILSTILFNKLQGIFQ